MSDRIERACTQCGSLLHHEDDCPNHPNNLSVHHGTPNPASDTAREAAERIIGMYEDGYASDYTPKVSDIAPMLQAVIDRHCAEIQRERDFYMKSTNDISEAAKINIDTAESKAADSTAALRRLRKTSQELHERGREAIEAGEVNFGEVYMADLAEWYLGLRDETPGTLSEEFGVAEFDVHSAMRMFADWIKSELYMPPAARVAGLPGDGEGN